MVILIVYIMPTLLILANSKTLRVYRMNSVLSFVFIMPLSISVNSALSKELGKVTEIFNSMESLKTL